MELEYLIRRGTGLEPTPAFIMLHGFGSNKEDLFSFENYLPAQHTVISLQAPISNPYGGYAWFDINSADSFKKQYQIDQAKNSIDLVNQFVQGAINKFNLNENDISLIGFSQGAILSWALAFGYPNQYRRIISLSGFILEEILPIKEPTFLAYASHGVHDQMIPIELPRSTIKPLLDRYPEVVYHEFEDGHHLSNESLESMINWIKKTELQ